nr:hypothetical protein Itr_chr05CG08880 [Ipomoea trifida]
MLKQRNSSASTLHTGAGVEVIPEVLSFPQVSCFTLKIFHIFVLHIPTKLYGVTTKEEFYILKLCVKDSAYEGVDIPESAKVWRPPAATEVILIPGSSATRQGGAERDSSAGGGLSISCLKGETFLRFGVSSPVFLLSRCNTDTPADLEP